MRPFSSSSMGLGPSGTAGSISRPEGCGIATIAAGCFWGPEQMYRKHFGGKGLYDARVGYIGGDTDNPSYRAVCSGSTGRKSIFSKKNLEYMLMDLRCRSSTDYLRPKQDHIHPDPRLLLQDA